MVHVLGPRDNSKIRILRKNGIEIIDTTSRSKKLWTAQLSPFYLGPVSLYHGEISQNVENGWQYSKVYACHLDDNGNPTRDYWTWARTGWRKKRADRYPMGKGAVPEYSYWRGEKLDYIDARKKIYFPLYAGTVKKTHAFNVLKNRYLQGEDLYLWDFDGYDYIKEGIPLKAVIDNPEKKMGHAFVLAMLLEYERNKYAGTVCTNG